MEEGEALLGAGIAHEDDAAEMLAVLSCLVNLLGNLSDLVEVILSDILSTHDFLLSKNLPTPGCYPRNGQESAYMKTTN